MTRIIGKDFQQLINFIDGYSLSHLLSDQGFIKLISSCHKKHYSYLTIVAELRGSMNDKQLLFLSESTSDTATSLFHLFSGSYKSSKLILRSSIETFLKGFSCEFINNIDEEKSVYVMFDTIKSLPYFDKDFTKNELDIIHSCYKELCKDVHSANEINMEKISALNSFPKYSKKEADCIISTFIKLIPCYITLLCHKENISFHKIHYTNKDIILNSINKSKRPIINNVSSC